MMSEWFFNVLADKETNMDKALEQKKKALATLLEQMEIPSARKDISKESNVRWLLRNLVIQNKSNPMFETTQKMVVWFLRNNKTWE
tara:strand:+ start:1091 stop:1348 length:258 start_codon:yes stop_codon:yes gene_type:complete